MRKLLRLTGLVPQVVRHGATVVDRRAPLALRMAALATLIYAISPIDLIPDFVPVLGWVDDATLVSMLLMAVAKWFMGVSRARMVSARATPPPIPYDPSVLNH